MWKLLIWLFCSDDLLCAKGERRSEKYMWAAARAERAGYNFLGSPCGEGVTQNKASNNIWNQTWNRMFGLGATGPELGPEKLPETLNWTDTEVWNARNMRKNLLNSFFAFYFRYFSVRKIKFEKTKQFTLLYDLSESPSFCKIKL